MSIISFISQFFNVATLAGIIILTRFMKTQWIVIAIAILLIVVGLIAGGSK